MSQSRPFFGCLVGTFSPLTSPQTLDPLVIDCPPGISEQGRDPPVAVTSILSRQFDHVSNQPVFVRPSSGQVALRRSTAADVQDRDGGLALLATLFGLFPFLGKLFADSASG